MFALKMKQLTYTGIGSRKAPILILEMLSVIAVKLSKLNYIVRSGGATGCDKAFEVVPEDKIQIFVPWNGFNGVQRSSLLVTDEALSVGHNYHPNWDRLTDSVRKLHARNIHQVLGHSLNDPSQFVLCWTPDGCEDYKTRTKLTGGTGSAIEVANKHNVPVFNLFNENQLKRLGKFVDYSEDKINVIFQQSNEAAEEIKKTINKRM